MSVTKRPNKLEWFLWQAFNDKLYVFKRQGMLLALLANNAPGERFARDKRSSLFCANVSDEEKKFYNIDANSHCYQTFFFVSDGGGK